MKQHLITFREGDSMSKEVMAECLEEATCLYHGVKSFVATNPLASQPQGDGLPIATIAVALYQERCHVARDKAEGEYWADPSPGDPFVERDVVGTTSIGGSPRDEKFLLDFGDGLRCTIYSSEGIISTYETNDIGITWQKIAGKDNTPIINTVMPLLTTAPDAPLS